MNKPSNLRYILYGIAVIAVVVIAGLVRWRAINLLPVDYDEDDYLLAAQQYAGLIKASDWKGFTETNYRPEHPPFAKIIYGISILPLPEAPPIPDVSSSADPNPNLPKAQLHTARTASAVFGTAEVLLLAIVNPLAGLFLAVQTFTIKYTSQVMLEAVPAFTSLAAVVCYTQSKRRNGNQAKNKRIYGWLVASAVFLGLTAASKYIYCVAGLTILADWILSSREKNSAKRVFPKMLLWGVLAIFIFFLANPYLWPAPIERLKGSIFFLVSYSQSTHVQQTGWPFWQPLVWLAQSVPWHPGVFVVSIDIAISILAICGLSRMWSKQRIYGLWLGIAVFFLLIWPTKWQQYILILTAPLSVAAAEGVMGVVVEPIKSIWIRLRTKHQGAPSSMREMVKATPWLLPGVITLSVLILYPIIYETAMSLTDLSGQSLKDGIQGGVWREVWQGLTGQAQPVDTSSRQFANSTTVQYAGTSPIKAVFSGSPEIIVFELLWTVLSVGLQALLGISIALLLNQRGVRFRGVWRTIFIIPWAIPEFVGALVWLRTFDPTVGWVSQAFGTSGGGGGAVLVSKLLSAGGPNLALLLLLIAATWIGFPIIMLSASASLKLIPEDVYDAAAIDGAARWSLFRFITWPLLLPLVVPVLIIRAIYAFNQFYLFYVFAPSFRDNSLGTFSFISYFYFKEYNLYSISAAINVVTVIVLIILLLIFNHWSKAIEGVTYA